MQSSSIATVTATATAVLFAFSAPAGATQIPVPAATTAPSSMHDPRFSSKITIPTRQVSIVSSAACNRRAIATDPTGNTMGPSGATKSQTIVAVPIGMGNVGTATTQQQINDVCAP